MNLFEKFAVSAATVAGLSGCVGYVPVPPVPRGAIIIQTDPGYRQPTPPPRGGCVDRYGYRVPCPRGYGY